MGSDTIAWSRLGQQAFTFRADSELDLTVGQKIRLGFDPARASIFDAASGERI
jgi:multiple sugar transport system ATP-binding protein